MADEHPKDPLFDEIERWQDEENHYQAQADRMGRIFAVALGVMTFTAVLIYLLNG